MGGMFDITAFRSEKQVTFSQPTPDYISKDETSNLNDLTDAFLANSEKIKSECAAYKYVIDYPTEISEPLWRTALGITAKCTDGGDISHEISRRYPGYNHSETQTKIDSWKGKGAPLCTTIAQCAPQLCDGCKHRGRIKSPISLGQKRDVTNETENELRLLNHDAGRIAFSNELPPHRDFVIWDLILAVKVCVLAGFGGVSKTQWALQAAVCIALGLLFMGKKAEAGAVLLLLGEEDRDEIARRFNAVVRAMQLTQQQIELVSQRTWAFPMVGLDSRLTRRINGSLEGTALTKEIIAAATALEVEAGVPVRLIGLDHAGLIHGGEFNAREDVVQTMRQVNQIAQETGAAVMVLAHSPKAAANDDKANASAVAGSAAWVDLARAVFVLRTMSDEEGRRLGIDPTTRASYASMTVVKNNYAPTGTVYWLQRETVEGYGVGFLRHIELSEPVKAPKGSEALQASVLEFINGCPGQFSKTGLRDTHGGKDGRFKVSKSELATAIENLISNGQMLVRDATPEDRQKYGHHQTVKQVMEGKS
jgi:hypothetical protein